MDDSVLGSTLLAAYAAFLPFTWQLALLSAAVNQRDESELFGGRFELDDRRKQQADNILVDAKDIHNNDQPVVIKFMANQEAFTREARRGNLDPKYFLDILATSRDPKIMDRWAHDVQAEGLSSHPYGIVQPVVQERLDVVLQVDDLSLVATATMLRDAARALQNLHANGRIHGCFQLSSVVQKNADTPWQAVNLDASVPLGTSMEDLFFGCSPPEAAGFETNGTAGLEFSTFSHGETVVIVKPGSSKFGEQVVVIDGDWNGMVKVDHDGVTKSFNPYELKRLEDFEAGNQEEEKAQEGTGASTSKGSIAAVTHDIWAFGLLVFQAFVKRPLFNCNRTGHMASQTEVQRLKAWGPLDLRHALWELDHELTTAWGMRPKERLEIVELVGQLLQPDPADRAQSFDDLLEHGFFTFESSGVTEEEMTTDLSSQMPVHISRRVSSHLMWLDEDTAVPLWVLVALGDLQRFNKAAMTPDVDLNGVGMFNMSLLHVAVEARQVKMVERLLALTAEGRFDVNQIDSCGWHAVHLGLELLDFMREQHRTEEEGVVCRVLEMIAKHAKSDLTLRDQQGRSSYTRGKSSKNKAVRELFQQLEYDQQVMSNLRMDKPFPHSAFNSMWKGNDKKNREQLKEAFWDAVHRNLAPPVSHHARHYLEHMLLPLPVLDGLAEFKRLQDFSYQMSASLVERMLSSRDNIIIGVPSNGPTDVRSSSFLLALASSQFAPTTSFVSLTGSCKSMWCLRVSSMAEQAALSAKLLVGAALTAMDLPGKVKQDVPKSMVKELKGQAVEGSSFLDQVEEKVIQGWCGMVHDR